MSVPEEATRHTTVFDDQTRHLARIYAEALLDSGRRENREAELLEELESLVRDVLDRGPYLDAILGSPAIGRERKDALIERSFDGRTSELLFRFLKVLNHHQRLDILRQIALVAREVFETRSGRVKVEVESAVPLADDQQERLRQDLRHTLQREPVLHLHVDPELLGGLLVRVGDRVYDATLRGRINSLRTQLIERR